MRTTVRIDHDLMERLKAQARPRVALYKALALAGALDDAEVLRGLALPPAGRDWR